MKAPPPIALLLLNAALIATLAFVSLAPTADAQQNSRPRGRYGIVTGWVLSCDSEVAYIVDEANQEVVAVTWDERVKQLTGMGYRNIAQDFASFQQNR